MNSKELMELAARCERASGPDFTLDAEIAVTLGLLTETRAPKHYSASLDAALTLVSEGLVYSLGNDQGFCWAWVGKRGEESAAYTAETIALALVAASLRALAEEEG